MIRAFTASLIVLAGATACCSRQAPSHPFAGPEQPGRTGWGPPLGQTEDYTRRPA